MGRIATLCVLVMCAASVAAQETGVALAQGQAGSADPRAAASIAQDASPAAQAPSSVSGIINIDLLRLPFAQAPGLQDPGPQAAPPQVKAPSQPAPETKQGFQWVDAFKQYLMVLTFQHIYRLPQERTHSELGGPFWADYVESVASLRGWNDGDPFFTNYVAHPFMGAVTGLIQVQNDPAGRCVQFGKSRAYWRSRGWALAASTIYSLQFELGPLSEASIGNVGIQAGRMAYVDLVVTPLVGLGMIVAEDAVDRYLIAKVEGRMGRNQARLLRSLLNPNRSIANLIRFQVPWKRDGRSFPPGGSRGVAMPVAPRPGGEVSTR